VNILIIGGTAFLGRHLVDAALLKGHTVTLFNRGKTNPNIFTQIEKLIGDRNKDLSILKERKWDVVIDTCGFFPSQVRKSSLALKDSVNRYIFISTMSVYKILNKVSTSQATDESSETSKLKAGQDAEVDDVATYGARKKLCEEAVDEILPGKTLHLRPCVIVGPYDTTWRFPYWVERISRGGNVLAPGDPKGPVRFIDGRDLAEWTLDLAQKGATGIFNALGPDPKITFGQFLEGCRTTLNESCRLHWASEEFLTQNQVQQWKDLPLWVTRENLAIHEFSDVKARKLGLRSRDFRKTISETLDWIKRNHLKSSPDYGLNPHREAELLGRLSLFAP
jgi:2'-hydroxyisoflavone reductase